MDTISKQALDVTKWEVLQRRQLFYQRAFANLDMPPTTFDTFHNSLFGDGEASADIYTYPAAIFGDMFVDVDAERIVDLSYAGRMLLDHIILYDLLIDVGFDPGTLMLSYACQREYLQCLLTILPPDCAFWKYHDQLDTHTKRVVLNEKSQQADEAYTYSAYRATAYGKACMSNLAIWSLLELSDVADKQEKAAQLLKSIECFTVAFQILDDLSDWHTDLAENNITYPLHLAIRAASLPEGANLLQFDTPIKHKLYTMVAMPLLEVAACEIESALEFGKGSNAWCESLHKLQTRIALKTAYIADFLQIAESNRLNLQRATMRSNSAVQASCRAAVAYLVSRQKRSGCWQDFVTFVRQTDVWVTGYVAAILAEVDDVPQETLLGAKAFLLGRSKQIGQSTDHSVFCDADSVAWCARALTLLGASEHQLLDLFSALADYQHRDGAFSAYRDQAALYALSNVLDQKDVDGWLQGHSCVTATAMGTLLLHEASTAFACQAADSLLSCSADDVQDVQSYWWLTPMYTLCQFAHALQIGSATLPKSTFTAQALIYLSETQSPQGSWNLSGQPETTVFETALAVWTLSMCGQPEHHDLLQRGVDWLLSKQNRDGSWLPSAPLRIPLPSDRAPWQKRTWSRDGLKGGFEHVCYDQSRIYTSATVLQALEHYRVHHLKNTTQVAV